MNEVSTVQVNKSQHTVESDSDTERCVQSCISSVSFPAYLDDLEEMLENHDEMDGIRQTDIQNLLSSDEIDGWTAPKWLTTGDVMYFYCTKNAALRSKALLREVEREGYHDAELTALLQCNVTLTKRYAGTIFACACLSDAATTGEPSSGHFASRLFAPVEQITVFQRPLPLEQFAEYVQIGQNTITPLYGRQAAGLRALLARENALPAYLQHAAFGDHGFRQVNATNWQEISCQPSVRFLHEVQLRVYLLDYLLDQLKDVRALRLEECICIRDARETGRADYMIQVAGQWVPIEAKLNIRAEADILGQVNKYIAIDRFVPTQGHRRDVPISTARAQQLCLVVDQEGIYPTIDGAFTAGCTPDRPLWRRTDLNGETITEIRSWIIAHIGERH